MFVVLGIWFVTDADNLTNWWATNPTFIRGSGLASILFFGLGIYVSVIRLTRPKVALILDSEGININPKRLDVDLIKWDEIVGFEEITIQRTRIFTIEVKNPEFWIDKETNTIRKRLMQFNMSNYGTPFNIAASGLDISSIKLKHTLNHYFGEYHTQVPPNT